MILTRYSIKMRVTVLALVALLCVAGPLIYFGLPREGAPDVTIPMVFVTATYEGVAPAEIENLVTLPLEQRFNGIENIKKMASTSMEGAAVVVIEFLPRQNIDLAVQKVKDKIDMAKADLPRDLDPPVVQGFNFSTDIPVFTFAIAGDEDLERLERIAEDYQDLVEAHPGVLEARLYGGKEREIRVDVDLQRLLAYRLAPGALVAAIRGENVTVSAGNLELRGDKFQVRVPGEFTDPRRLRDVVVAVRDGQCVRVSDVAEVRDGYKDATTISRVNGRPCVTVAVHKRAGENADGLIRELKRDLDRNAPPAGLALTYVNDQSEFIELMIEDLENNIVSGSVMVVAILLLFLGLRTSVLVGAAIPLSLMVGFVALAVMGMTLNMMVLFSLILTVGMLVDNAIVLVENIYRHHAAGKSRREAALQGAAEVAWPVTTSTLTTLVAFWPMLYWPDIMGQFMSFLPKTVIVMLSASLFVALAINPAIASVFIGRSGTQGRLALAGGHRWGRVMDAYAGFLRGALRRRWLCLFIGFAFLAFTVLLFGRYSKGVELFPDVEPQRATITVRYPEGVDLATTDATLKSIERTLARFPDIRFYLSNTGSAGDWALTAASGSHLGSIQIEFVRFGERSRSTLDVVKDIRAGIGDFPGAEVRVASEEMGPPVGAAVSIEVSGDDFGRLRELSDAIQQAIVTVPGLVDVQDNLEDSRPELQFRVDRQRAALLGLDTRRIGEFLRAAINGEEAGKFRAGEDEHDITVRLREDQRRSVDLLKQLALTTPAGERVPLASLGGFVYEGGRGRISRQDQKRLVTITGNVQGRGADAVLAEVKGRVAAVPLPKGYRVDFTGKNKEMNDSMAFLKKAFVVALALIALILVMEFNSLIQPAIVMTAVILSLVGVLWGLLLCGMRFGVIMTGIGVVSLAGIVVNNGIVLIDCINKRREAGLAAVDAIIDAGRTRLRPVLLTAITTVAGLIPMAVGWSVEIHEWPPRFVAGAETSAWWSPMAVAVIFGLSVATVLTLVQVPVMYSLTESLSAAWKRWRGEP
jgi:CzcA family heavy metal efflux pump